MRTTSSWPPRSTAYSLARPRRNVGSWPVAASWIAGTFREEQYRRQDRPTLRRGVSGRRNAPAACNGHRADGGAIIMRAEALSRRAALLGAALAHQPARL